jgi:uncharacterized protein YndB with AHSA1/START domain
MTKRDIVVEELLPHAPETVWKLLTSAELIARWLMPNDFKPVGGHRFNFRTKPMGEWDGVIDCEVLEVVPNRKLVYSWKGGSDRNPGYGSKLDTVVTWTLTPVGEATRLRLVHAGFRPGVNDSAYEAMRPGWRHVFERMRQVAGAGV